MATELESLIHAKGYLDKLANGINPLTDEFLPETDECQRRFEDLRGYGERMLSYDFAVYSEGVLSLSWLCIRSASAFLSSAFA